MNILIISAACCYPGMAAFDEQAKSTIEKAAQETGIEAEVRVIPGVTAIYSGVVPKRIMNELMKRFSKNETGPAVLINGEVVSYGVPQLEDMKTILKKILENNRQE